MTNEQKEILKYIGLSICMVLVLSILWFMFFYEPSANSELTRDSNHVETGLQRTQGDIERIQGDIERSKDTTTDIEQSTQGISDGIERIQESNRTAEESIGDAERTSGNIEAAIDHSIERLNESQRILGKYSK